MKITDVEVLLIDHPLPTDREAPRPWKPLIVKINTDEGIYGLGEIGMAYGYGATAGWGMAKDLAKMIIGKDPMNTERIWEDMMKKTFWGQGARYGCIRRNERYRYGAVGLEGQSAGCSAV